MGSMLGWALKVEVGEAPGAGKLAKRMRPERRQASVAWPSVAGSFSRISVWIWLLRVALSSAVGQRLGGGGEMEVGEVGSELLVEAVFGALGEIVDGSLDAS